MWCSCGVITWSTHLCNIRRYDPPNAANHAANTHSKSPNPCWIHLWSVHVKGLKGSSNESSTDKQEECQQNPKGQEKAGEASR